MEMLTINLAESKDTNGAFFLVESTLVPGTEPPPHVHSREDELFYVLEGAFDVYVGHEAFKVETGQCVFLPKFKPHGWIIRSPRLRVLALFAPGGLEEAFRRGSAPAQNLELPTEALTYAQADAEQTAQRFSEYGLRFLTADEVTNELPLFPKSVPADKLRTDKLPFKTLAPKKEKQLNQTPSPLKAFKRTESLGPSKWYMGTLMTNLAETKDTNGAFLLVQGTLVPGTEPPPHVHSREDELFYVLEGEFDVYVGEDIFTVETGQCVFLPRLKPHTFIIRSPRIRLLTLVTPAGLEEVFRDMSTPAEKLEAPSGALTYSQADLNQTVQRFTEYGVRILNPEEVAEQMPLFPKPLIPSMPGDLTTDQRV